MSSSAKVVGPRVGNPESETSAIESETSEIESETTRKRIGNQETNESETSKTRVGNQASNQKPMENDSETTREPSRKSTEPESETLGPIRKPAGSELETLAKLYRTRTG